jgi:hypothetical protein
MLWMETGDLDGQSSILGQMLHLLASDGIWITGGCRPAGLCVQSGIPTFDLNKPSMGRSGSGVPVRTTYLDPARPPGVDEETGFSTAYPTILEIPFSQACLPACPDKLERVAGWVNDSIRVSAPSRGAGSAWAPARQGQRSSNSPNSD